MKYRYATAWISFLFSFLTTYSQQSAWPVQVQAGAGATIKVYEPQPASFQNGILKIRSAISVLNANQQDPVFGVIWADVNMDGNGNQLYWKGVSISSIKLPGDISDQELSQLKRGLETALPGKNISISQSELNARLNSSKKENELATTLSTQPPRIIYTKKPSLLVNIDGQPQLQQNPDWGVEQVVNTPFTIVKSDGQYYLYGEKKWYRASAATGPWTYTDRLPSSLTKINEDIQANDTTKSNYVDYTVPDIVISTEPAELIQSNGEANFSPIEGTDLLYMTNSVNDIFMDVNSQQYYVLVSGRWYRSSGLSGNWNYVPASSLPQDFARIPDGSSKDGVLSSVAGTEASREALMDAQLPQTARVDRRTATTDIAYDGEPRFERIDGTRLRYAVNTSGTVLNLGRDYYAVQNGVWFESGSPYGPWTVATRRPDELDYIPPSYPVYNTKYVYIYDVTPDWVYMGYTPGYLGTYAYGPTVFYGTGYYYRPWRGRYYYPRPITWGYNMRYNPWYGWGSGINLNFGWFNIGIGNRYRSPFWGCSGGWFGPTVYCPAYYRPTSYYGGRVNNVYTVNNYYGNSYNTIYTNRRGVVTHERPPYAYNRNISRPASPNGNRYYNANGYNNNNNRVGQNENPGRTNSPMAGPDRGSRNNGRAYNPQSNNGINNRFPDNNRTTEGRTQGGFGNNRLPGQQQNGGFNNGQPDMNRTPVTPDGNRDNNTRDRQTTRPYQMQPQTQPGSNDNSRNPVYSDRNRYENRQQNGGMDRSTFPQENRTDRQQPQQPQVRERPAMPNFGNQSQPQENRVERQQPQQPQVRERPAMPNFGNQSQPQENRMERQQQPQQRVERMPAPQENRGGGNRESGGGEGGGRPVERPQRGGRGG